MNSERENSPPPTRPSNEHAGDPWRRLGRACREASHLPRGGRRTELLLRHALAALGAERAFLVGTARGGKAEIRACCSVREDGRSAPSRTLLRRALSRRRTMVCPDLQRDARLADGESVRSLRLRFVVAVPVPLPGGRRTALLLDSRLASPLVGERARELARSFAALIGLALAAAGEPTLAAAAEKAGDEAGPPPRDEEVELIGRSPASRELLGWIRRVAPSELPVLVRGETGTGKEAVARALHRSGPRGKGPFVAVNCTALSESLLEAELFGSARGAYTGADRDRPGLFRLAHGGTLLLDEVGDTSPAMQAKLLRALQERRVRPVGGEHEIPVDVRVLAATHRDLAGMVRDGRFRADLYHRLAVLEVRVPPLRERKRDLFPLVRDLGVRLARETGCGPPRLAVSAWRALCAYPWPGNVRELHSVLARALLRAPHRTIVAGDLDLPRLPPPPVADDADDSVDLERRMIESALHAAGGCIAAAARRIGWTRQKLYRRIRALSIEAGGSAYQERTTSSDSSTFQ